MSELTENSHLQSNIKMPVIRGEITLIVIILINSLGVVLMLYSGSYPVCRMRFHWCFQRFLLEPGPIFFRDF